MAEGARPPRGWLIGVVLTMGLSWLPSAAWTQFQADGRPMTLVGAGITMAGLAVHAYQAFTNENYRTSTATRVGNMILLIGLIILGVMKAIDNK